MNSKKLFTFIALLTAGLGSTQLALAKTPEDRLAQLKIELPVPNAPVANYRHAVRVGNLLYLAGKGPEKPSGVMRGKLGLDLNVQEGYEASRLTAITLLGVLKSELGELSRVKKIVKLNGYVNAVEEFEKHPQVINGASDLLVAVFGEAVGKHARLAVGTASLPFNIPVEIDLVVEVAKAKHVHSIDADELFADESQAKNSCDGLGAICGTRSCCPGLVCRAGGTWASLLRCQSKR